MRKTLLLALFSVAGMSQWVMAQGNRYLSEVFTDAQIAVTNNVVYGVNHHFFPPTTTYPVANLTMRVYQPSQAVDTANQARPVMVFIHTGNFLPPVINGGITGSIDDSSAVNLCKQWAKRGYVVIAPKYRVGWNPLAATQLERTAQLLNAVYRAINDIKTSVRFLRKTVAIDGNPYKIDQNRIALFGVGSGGYVALAYATMNQMPEIYLPKFLLPNGQSVIDTTIVGNLDGFGGVLNQNNWQGYSSAVNMSINVGGAMADTSWLDGGEVPMVSFQSVRDPFAPYRQGIVVVPTTNENVVEVQGAGIFQALVNAYGNNAPFADVNKFRDPVSNVARSNYNLTIPYIYPAPNDQINTGSGEGLWPIIRPVRNLPLGPGGSITTFFNETDPYTWWDSTTLTFVVAATNAQTGGSYNAQSMHQQGLLGNPGMSRIKGLTFIDTIQQYIHPRIVHTLDLATNVTFRVNMSGLTVNSAGMHIAGNFNGLNPGSTALTQDPTNANIWSYTTKLTPGDNLQFKFINGNSWGQDESIPAACAVGGYRGHTVSGNGNDTLPAVAFGSCNPPAPVLATVSGRFTYNNTAMTPMTNSVVSLMNGTVVVASDSTDATGDYSIAGVPAGSYIVKGATSKAWGGVTASDALLATRHVVGSLIQTGLRLQVCDVNNSNSITSGDALLINRRFAGSVTSFNVGNFAYNNPSISVGSANMTQNLQALCYGDINGSYTPNVNARFNSISLIDAGQVNGNVFAISADRNLELGSVSLVMNIPAGVTVRELHSKLSGGQLDYQISGNQVRLGWYNTEGMNIVAGQDLVELILSNSRDVNSSEWTLGSESELTDVWAEAYSGAALRIPSLRANAVALSIFPNPVGSQLGIRLPLQSSASIKVEVLDATGRLVTACAFEAAAGEFAQQISLEGLAKGQYMLRLTEQGAQRMVLHNARFVR